MGRKSKPGTKRLIRLREEQWVELRRIADTLSEGGKKRWSVTEVVSLAVDAFVGEGQGKSAKRKVSD